jgi:hypothetical protein
MPELSETTRPAPEARQETIDALCESFARDELEMGELETRLEMVHRAQTGEQLSVILADLTPAPVPAKHEAQREVAASRKVAASRATIHPSSPALDLAPCPTLPDDRIPDHSVIIGIMGGGERSGSWIPARNNWAVGVMGGCQVDFRDAQLGSGATEVRVLAVMGGVEILAPPDIHVEYSGIGIMGGFGVDTHYRPPAHPDAPILRVTGLAIMGGVRVTVRYPGETARDAKYRLKAEHKARKLLERGGK